MQFNHVYIVGLGALGVMYGAQIEAHAPKGTLRFIASPQRQQRYKEEGIYCNNSLCRFDYIAPGDSVPPADLLIFAVKAGALAAAMQDARFAVGPHTLILSVLNGISSEEELARAFGAEKVLPCVVQGMDATKTQNRLTYTKLGTISFGEANGEMSERVKALAFFLQSVGLFPDARTDIMRHMWSKFMLNCGVNQAAAVYETNYGGLQTFGPPRTAMLAAMGEVMSISQKTGVDLTQKDIDAWMNVLATLSPQGMPSMRQDALARRKTELELFAGTARRLGNETGVPTPQNDAFYEAIAKMEAGW